MDFLKEEHLVELSNLFNSGLKKANKKEVSKAKRNLCFAIESDPDGMQIVMKHINTFPPDIISEAISEVWNNIEEESKKNVISYISEKSANNIELKLYFLSHYCKHDAGSALRLFSNICRHHSENEEKSDKVAFLRLLRNTVLDSSSLFLSKTTSEIKTLDVSELPPLVSAISRAAFANSKNDKLYFNANLQRDALMWMANAESAPNLPDDLVKAVSVNIAKWPIIMLSDIKKLLSCFNESLREEIFTKLPTLNIHCHPEQERDSIKAKKSLKGSTEGKKHDKSGTINSKEVLQQVIDYISELEQKIIVIENDYRIKFDKSKLRNSELVEKLEDEREKINQVNKSLSELNKKNSKLQKKHDKLECAYKDMIEKHASEIHKLTEKIDFECNYQLGVFKNRIAEKFRIDVDELKNIEDKPMSKKLGENLRLQLSQLFAKLKQEGVNIDS